MTPLRLFRAFQLFRHDAYAYRERLLRREAQTASLLMLEMRDHTLGQCFEAAHNWDEVMQDDAGHIASILYSRSGRGTATLEDAHDCLRTMKGNK